MVSRIWLGSAIYAVVYFVVGWDRYATYHSGADLGLFVQTMASAFQAGGFRNTLEASNHFVFHFSPIFYLCAPFVVLTHSALALVAIQAIACALVAPGLYAIASRYTDEQRAFTIGAIGWLYPPLAGVTFTDFHENGFVPAATVWLLWALDARRLGFAALFAAILLVTKEDQGLFLAVVGIGVAVFFARRDGARAWFGVGLTCAALGVFAVYFAVVRPHYGASEWIPLHFYGLGGLTARGPTTPLFSFGRLTYLIEAFLPLLLVPLFSPLVLTALPGFAECLLSREPLTYTMGQHYAAVWIGYVLVAYAFAARRLGKWARVGPLIASTLVLIFASPTHWGHFLQVPNHHDSVLDRFVASIPQDASVGTHDEVYAHLGFVPGAQIGLDPLPQLALFDYTYHSTAWDASVRPRFERLLAAGAYRIVRSEDHIVLAEKTRK